MKKRKVIAYIDGLNLFYCSLKGTANKWLDIVSLCESLLPPNSELVAVKYFSAMVSHPRNPQKAMNQSVYLEALETNPKFEKKLGFFAIRETQMPRASDFAAGKIRLVNVIKTEEKGTDVNLAVQMVADAKDNKFDYAMLFSNDSDMAQCVKIAVVDCGKQVGLFIDGKSKPIKILKRHVLHIKNLTPNKFAAHQFPNPIVTTSGRTIAKPADWL